MTLALSITAFIGGFLTALALTAYLHEDIHNAIRRHYAKNQYWPAAAVKAVAERDGRIAALERANDMVLDSRAQALTQLRHERQERRLLELPELIRLETHPESYFHHRQAG